MIIDSHTHLFSEFAGVKCEGPAALVRAMDENDVDKSILCTLEGFIGDAQAGNEQLRRWVQEFPDRFYAFCTVSPYDGQRAVEELRRCVESCGMRGLKLHPWLQAFSVVRPYMFPIVEECIRLDVPLVFHDGSPPYSTTFQIAYLADMYPEANIILAHSGLMDMWRAALQAARRHSNIYLSSCTCPYFAVQRLVEEFGGSRMMFGSDGGFGTSLQLTYELMKVQRLDVSETDRAQLLGGTIARIARLPGVSTGGAP